MVWDHRVAGSSPVTPTMEIVVHYNTEKPKNDSKIIINWAGNTHVGVFRENEKFTNKENANVVVIHYNGASIPWETVERWVYVDEIF